MRDRPHGTWLKMLLVMLLFTVPTSGKQPSYPNVLFIAVDDLNDWVGVLGGHPQAQTPHIDRLAARGTLFTRAYCAAPACNPSRVALMTGRRPSTTGVYFNGNPWRPAWPDVVTIPQHFSANGYHAIGSGKIFHGRFPDPASWDEFFPSKTQQRPADPMPRGRPLNGLPRTAHFDWGPVQADDADMGDSQVVDWVIQQLNQAHDQPIFLACGIYRPHLPWYVPQKYFDSFPLESIVLPAIRDDDLDDIPAAGIRMARPQGDHRRVTQHQQWKQAVQGYLASVRFADAQIGRLLDALDRSAYADNTMIIFWTDHGWHHGQKEHWRKFALWEQATRTPLVIVTPAAGGQGRQCHHPVNLIDLYPTLIELCGLTPRAGLDGTSLVPLLKNPNAEWRRPSLTTHGYKNHAVRSRRYRYIRYANGDEELYDHEKDPNEWENLASVASSAGVKDELAKWLPNEDAPEVQR